MKKLFKYLSILAISAVAATSCSEYLEVDKYFNDRMTLENVFTSQDYTEQWLADTYSHLKDNALIDVCGKYTNPHNFADDQLYGDHEDAYERLCSGKYENVGDTYWAWYHAYTAIRKASIMIENVDMLIADSRYVTEEDVKDYKAQARFLRAYMYFYILRKYGPVPILGEGIIDYDDSYLEVSLPRNSYDECAEFIATEMAKAAEDLPLTRQALDINRPTKGAALAFRAKALIYAASPWNNPKEGAGDPWTFPDLVDDTGRKLMGQEYDDEKWAKAAAACKDVMDLGVYQIYVAAKRAVADGIMYPVTPENPNESIKGKAWPDGCADIDPFQSYRALFDGTLSQANNPELIWSRGDDRNMGQSIWHQLARHQMPITQGAWNVHAMTLKQADAYYMNDGTDVPGKDKEIGRGDGSNRPTGFTTAAGEYPYVGANVHKMFVNREPRFYASVGFNGSYWGGLSMSANDNSHLRNIQVFYYNGLNDGRKADKLWLRTGIGIKKYVHPQDGATGSVNKIMDKPEPALRYADILLWYAEAINELEGEYSIPSWDGTYAHDLARNKAEMQRGIQPIRYRAGLPDYDDATYADVAKFRAKLQRERQIEFFAETARWYDVRRWKTAPEELNLPVYGMSTMFSQEQRDEFHIPTEIAQYAPLFTNKMYFWPIDKGELKRNIRLTQNPGWQTYD